MGTLNRQAWQNLIDEDLRWLLEQPRTLERDHIEVCLKFHRRIPPHVLDEVWDKNQIEATKKPEYTEDGVPMTSIPEFCQLWPCSKERKQLELHNGLMVCPICGASYGATPAEATNQEEPSDD